MNHELVSKYLNTYAESEARELPSTLELIGPFDSGLALPLRGESPSEIEQRLSNLQKIGSATNRRLIIVAVVNGIGESQPHYHRAHLELLSSLTTAHSQWHGHFLLQNRSPFLSVLWIDRALSNPFLSKQGVGLARKIGCDVLVQLRYGEALRGPWLFTSDGDAELPEDYFDVPNSHSSALHYAYRHEAHEFEGKQALFLYEIHLRYYFLGLLWAQSPYAYPSIGSCLAIHSDAYVHARGFQDRQAGEDFHLLNKLRKLGKIEYRSGQPITLRGRFSERVPFGTGQSTINIHAQLRKQESFSLYSPQAFVLLKQLLTVVNEALAESSERGQKQFHNYFESLCSSTPHFHEALGQLQVPRIFNESIATRTTSESRLRHFHTAFDALKTLRLIHLIERSASHPITWQEAIRLAPFCEGVKGNTDPEEVLHHLQGLEERHLGTCFLDLDWF